MPYRLPERVCRVLTSLATTAKAGLTPAQAGHVGAAQAPTPAEAHRLVAVDAMGGRPGRPAGPPRTRAGHRLPVSS